MGVTLKDLKAELTMMGVTSKMGSTPKHDGATYIGSGPRRTIKVIKEVLTIMGVTIKDLKEVLTMMGVTIKVLKEVLIMIGVTFKDLKHYSQLWV